MDWKIFFATFSAIFIAELGDKTQAANLCLAAKSNSFFSVFIGSVCAFAVVTLLTMLLSGFLSRYLKPEYIRYGAGVIFICFGVLMIAGKL